MILDLVEDDRNKNKNMNTKNKLSVSICVPAYNEAANIRNILEGLSHQKLTDIHINKIVVVSSGSTDNTAEIVEEFMQKNPRLTLINEPSRNGKAAAINEFLSVVDDPVVVIQSSDTIPVEDTIELLCAPFIRDEKIGMTGGAPIPLNDPNTCLGYIIHSWWWFHRNIPRFGEIVAFRNNIGKISAKTAVDEAYIQAKMIQNGYKVVHIDEAIVRNKGADNLGDLIKQRRRIFNGHSRLYREENVKIDNMTKSSLHLLLFKYKMEHPKQAVWLLCGIAIEFYARILGAMDMHLSKKNPITWDIATSTKRLRTENAK